MKKIGDIPGTNAINGEFTDGNVAGGVPPTILPAEIFNTWQRELIAVVTTAGLALKPTDYTQVIQAIQSLITSSTTIVGNSTAGYIKLPNGYKLQWGNYGTNVPPNGSYLYNWVYPFTTQCYTAIATAAAYSASAASGNIIVGFNEITKTSVKVYNWGQIASPFVLWGLGI